MFIDFVDARVDWPQFDNVCARRRNESTIRCTAPGRVLRTAPGDFVNAVIDRGGQDAWFSQEWFAGQVPVEVVCQRVLVE